MINSSQLKSPQVVAVKLKEQAEILVKKGHPWVFSNSIIKESKQPQNGDTAVLFDQKKNKFLALGIYDLNSPIRIKIVQAHKQARLNEEFFISILQKALEKRASLRAENVTGYRWIHGENDQLPGIVIDVYSGNAVIKVYSLAWTPYLNSIEAAITSFPDIASIVFRTSRVAAQEFESYYGLRDGDIIWGNLVDPIVTFKEYGVLFSANLIKGHKTGYFLDHRQNRRYIGSISQNKKVLDVFCYAGGFSVHALAGGASEVYSIDISKQALLMAENNAKLNKTRGKHVTIAGDAFAIMEDLIKQKKKFDIVVIDPPSFAKQASEISRAKTSYRRLAELGKLLVAKGGTLLMASCSSRIESEAFYQLMDSIILTDGKFAVAKRTQHDIDHPTTFKEGAYLKSSYYIKH